MNRYLGHGTRTSRENTNLSELHGILSLGLNVDHTIVRKKSIPLFEIGNSDQVCNWIIQIIEAGVDLQDVADSFLTMLCVNHAYQGDPNLFLESPAAHYLKGHGIHFEIQHRDNVDHITDLLGVGSRDKSLRKTLSALEFEPDGSTTAGMFLSFASLFLPKLVVGERACLEKVQRQIQIHAEQGLIQYPTQWQSVGHMMVVFRLIRVNFVLKFLLVHQGMHMMAGHDANDAIIANSISQTRFSGLLIVKTVLEHILQKTEAGVQLHPLARTSKVKGELLAFKSALEALASHREYAPFARLLNLSGVNNLEHGLYPQLSAIALGVATAHGSTLAGVNVSEQYQQLREAATEAEKQLQQHSEMRELETLGLDEQERKILATFHSRKNEINIQQTSSILAIRKERLRKLTEALTEEKNKNALDDEDESEEDDWSPENRGIRSNKGSTKEPSSYTASRTEEDRNNYNSKDDHLSGKEQMSTQQESGADDLDLFDLDDDGDTNSQDPNNRQKQSDTQQTQESSDRSDYSRRPAYDWPPGDRPHTTQATDEHTDLLNKDHRRNQVKPGRRGNDPRTLPLISFDDNEGEILDDKSDLPAPDTHSDPDTEESEEEHPDEELLPPAPKYSTKTSEQEPGDWKQPTSPLSTIPEEEGGHEANNDNSESDLIDQMYQHIFKTEGAYAAINYYYKTTGRPVTFTSNNNHDYTFPQDTEGLFPPWEGKENQKVAEILTNSLHETGQEWADMSAKERYLFLINN
ncbi:nucleoprotein [Cuevavirus lloviuense]|uniref:Nucleoprotein n=1 Tax=Cuevavirus lloviuense TaxID=3052148 RepID=A0ACD3VMI1_9MONO|nr:nucleoprotein [Cuevavirus lloviuense]UKR35326.1 nucleoprotein [Cuevavirus lloviuense]UKS50413.1 nucleoprotein [Cuevavirus lloviuense]WCB27557.1 nucleoprotein [Cuevavirus lloviuense]WJL97488.1 nucleoprotein [Cuevavirus lloviuense]